MSKIRPGNKWNSYLNGEWAKHVTGKEDKRITSKARRNWDKQVIKDDLELPEMRSKPQKRNRRWITEHLNWCGDWVRGFGRFAKKKDAIQSVRKKIEHERLMERVYKLTRYANRKHRIRNTETNEIFNI